MLLSVDYQLRTSKGLNSKFIFIMLTFSKMWLLDMLFMVMVAFTWFASPHDKLTTVCIDKYSYNLIINKNACLGGQKPSV